MAMMFAVILIILRINCSTFLETIDPPFQAFLIDSNVLQNLEENRCQAKHKIIRLAIDVGLSSSIRRENYNEYDIIHYEKPPNKDYLRVYDSDTRIIPRSPMQTASPYPADDTRTSPAMPNDTYEFTIRPLDGGRPMIDLFWMYSSQNESWVGGTAGDGSKYKYTYPRHNETCAGDLLGHIFWIPCNPRKVMEFEYGPKWHMDHPTSRFSWSSSQYNVRKNGKWSKSQMAEVYKNYRK
ncbi:hypothetical protein TELCIR_08557 [Teladorsagia circumcincta]|uniref:W02B3.4-like N-terminal domain-containing protein n=1 Tax=Teladorsagia circumcincta TaxID=45464 RepID=A0A2G9UIR1_TELCI|nr:hypothetical protein TELCIR_08557 [Teladorsagia circumcincta]